MTSAAAAYAMVEAQRYALALTTIAVAVAAVLIAVGWRLDVPTITASATTASTLALFLAGLKGGLLTFGGAYTAIPFVRDDTVGRGWMTDAQFLDSLALSGVLPAPLVISSTFVGWMCGGPAGALAITAGMFLPAFAFSMIFYEQLETLAEHKRLQMFLSGIAAAVVGLIAVTLIELGQATLTRSPSLSVSAVIFAVALAVVYRWKSKLSTPAVLVLGAGSGHSLSGEAWRWMETGHSTVGSRGVCFTGLPPERERSPCGRYPPLDFAHLGHSEPFTKALSPFRSNVAPDFFL